MKVVLCSAPLEAAESLASSLIEERVAACVSVLPGMRSTYRWEGAVESSEEALLMIKTADETLPALMSRIATLHPYDVPEIVALDAHAVHGPYARWVNDESCPLKPE
jgi:periplasmic divalent cation tolerance protein